MNKSKISKDEEFTKENLVGKSIVDPNGCIIGTCSNIFEDNKKLHLQVSIKTEINSDFIVEESIPISLISRVGEVILLKKSFDIKPINVEELISFEIPTNFIEKNEIIETQRIEKSNNQFQEETKKANGLDSNNVNIQINPDSEIKTIKLSQQKILTPEKTAKKSSKPKFEELFIEINNEDNTDNKRKLIENLLTHFIQYKSFKKQVLSNLLNKSLTSDIKIRFTTTLIFEELAKNYPKEILVIFKEGLLATYNEPSIDVETKMIDSLTNIATKLGGELLTLNFQSFFTKLFLKREFCKNVSINRIHNLNLKVFENNYYIQQIIIQIYLQITSKNKAAAKEYSSLIKDFNALIIAYSIIMSSLQEQWNYLMKQKTLTKEYSEAFLDSINNILDVFQEGNMRKLREIFDPKIGIKLSNKLIAKMIKTTINGILVNVTFLSLDTLCEFYQDDNNRIIQVLFELISGKEINAEIVFVENKTYISVIN